MGYYNDAGFYFHEEADLADPGAGFSELLNKPTTALPAAIHANVVSELAAQPTVVEAAAMAVEAKLDEEDVAFTLVRGGQNQGNLAPVRGAVTYNPNGGPFGAGSTKRADPATASAVSLAGAIAEPSGEVTITVWIKLDVPPTGQNRVALALGGTKVYIGVATGTGNLIFSAADAAFTTTIPIANGAWHFIEAAFSRASGITKPVALHVDGVGVAVPIAQTSQAWDSSLTVLGFTAALPQFDWQGEVSGFEIFTGQRTSFGVPTKPNAGGGRTLALSQLADPLVELGTIAYPPRPDGARPGMCLYVGSEKPTTWLSKDRWVVAL